MWLTIEFPSSVCAAQAFLETAYFRHGHGKEQRKNSFSFPRYMDLYGYKPRDSEGWWGMVWQASECEKLCEKTKRQDLATWDLMWESGNIILTASMSKNPPMNSQKLCCSHALLVDAQGCCDHGRAGSQPRGPHLQLWRQGTLNHPCNCTSHALRVISQLLESTLGLLCTAGWPHSNHLWGGTLVPCPSPDHAQGRFKRQTLGAKPLWWLGLAFSQHKWSSSSS